MSSEQPEASPQSRSKKSDYTTTRTGAQDLLNKQTICNEHEKISPSRLNDQLELTIAKQGDRATPDF